MATDSDILKDIRERFTYADQEWKAIREEGDINMRYVAGDPWDASERRAREDAHRPCLSEDELNQYFNQVINNLRANPRAVKFTPQGNGANDQTAEFYANKWREIEYRSNAQLAYTTAFENCVQRNVGWVRITTDWAKASSETPDLQAFLKEIWIQAIVNPNMVVPGPALLPDSSDMHYLLFVEQLEKSEFQREYPDATVTDFSEQYVQSVGAERWFRGGKVQVGEYWAKDKGESRTQLLLKPPPPSALQPHPRPVPVWKDQLDGTIDSDQVVDERAVDQFVVRSYLTNGVEILKSSKWPGKWIPFASCTGKVIYVNDGAEGAKRKILAMTDLARNPQMLYAYYCTTEAEIVGGIPKFPYFAYRGTLTPESQTLLQKSLHEPVAVIEVEPTLSITGQELLPYPQRQPWDPPLQGIQLGKESQRRAIQAAMGVSPLPSQAQRPNQKSGVALQQIEKTEQVGSFHFGANYDFMIRHIGVMGEDLIDKIHDTASDTAIRTADEKSEIIRINDPTAQKPIFTKGDHAVTVSSGPAADSQRDAVSQFVDSLSRIPEVMQLAGDLIVRIQSKTMNLGPLMDELADRLTPQQFQKPANGQEPDPKQLMAQNAQLTQQAQQMQSAIAQLSMEIKTKQQEFQMQGQNQAQKVLLESKADLAKLRMEIAGKILVARITAAKQSADLNAELSEEQIALALDHAHDAGQNALDRQHEVNMHLLQTATAERMAEKQHAQALEQGQADTAGTMATQAQQAALQPPTPPNGASA